MRTIIVLLLIGGSLGLSGVAWGLTADEQGIIEAPTLQILDRCPGGGSLFDCEEGTIEKGLLGKVTDGLFVVLMILAALMIVIAGYSFLTAAGDPEKVRKARDFVLYALVGVVVAFLARAFVALVHYYVSS